MSADVHLPFPDDGVTYCGWATDNGIHEGCGELWPCSTVRGIPVTAGPARTGGLSDLLDGLEAAAKAATPGPWEQGTRGDGRYVIVEVDEGPGRFVIDVADCLTDDDAACIVVEHNAAPRLTAALRAVLALADEFDAMAESASHPHPILVRGGRRDMETMAVVSRCYRRAASEFRAVVSSALGSSS